MKHPALMTIALALSLTVAHGQTTAPTTQTNPSVTGAVGTNVTEVFSLRDLINKRGRIVIGTNVSTTVEFDDNIAEWIVGRDDLMIEPAISKVNPNRVYLRAKAGSGSSNLDVTLAGGQTALFTFVIDAKLSEGKRYLIRNAAPTPAASATSTASANTASTPDWLKFNISATASDSLMSINYSLSNGGESDIVADANKLSVSVDGKQTTYKLSRQTTGPSNVLLTPKSVQNGNIVFASGDNVRVSWTLSDPRTRKTWLLQRDVTVARVRPSAPIAKPAAVAIAKPTKPATVQTLTVSSPTNIPTRPAVVAGGVSINQTPIAATTASVQSSLPIFDFIGTPPYSVYFSRAEAPGNVMLYFNANTVEGDRTTITISVDNIGSKPLTFDTADARIHVLSATGVNLASYVVKREIRELAAGKRWQSSGIVVTGPLKNVNLTLRWNLESFEFQRSIITFG